MKNYRILQSIRQLIIKSMTRIIVIVLLVTFGNLNLLGQVKWSFELHGGGVYNVPMPLTIHQQGYPSIKLMARFRTEAFTPPVYWDWRITRWNNNRGWEFEAIHHKLYLTNTDDEVQKFNISHGFNILTLNRCYKERLFTYRVGLGIVLTHSESKIRDKEFGDSSDSWDMGYFVSGPILNMAIGKPIRIFNRVHFNIEAKSTVSYTYIKINDGHANLFNFALHLVAGFGLDFYKKNQ